MKQLGILLLPPGWDANSSQGYPQHYDRRYPFIHLGEGDIGVCGVAVLLSFLCGIPVNKILHCGVAVISNPTVCDVCAFKPTVFGETKLFAVSRHQ